jgi:hypothetical protein
VSGAHAVFVTATDGVVLEDLGSTNGTTVNGARATRQVLQEGDRIDIGRQSFVYLADADAATPLAEIESLEAALRAGADVAIGSRALGDESVRIKAQLHRRVIGRVFHRLVELLAVHGVKDTQCGFKLFRGPGAHDLFSRMRIRGFSFDEVLMMAVGRLPDRRSARQLDHQPGSKVNLVTDSRECADLFVSGGGISAEVPHPRSPGPVVTETNEAQARGAPRRRPQDAALLTTARRDRHSASFHQILHSPSAPACCLPRSSRRRHLRSEAYRALTSHSCYSPRPGCWMAPACTSDVVEINPPLIVALNIPVVLAASASGCSRPGVPAAGFALLGLSLAASSLLLRRLHRTTPA